MSIKRIGIVTSAFVSLFAASACSSESAAPAVDHEHTGTSHSALTAAQCSYFDTNGKVQICHATGSAKHPYTILKVSETACASIHSGHAGDYIAVNDPTCGGGGCLPASAPCDATLPCCDGSACTGGICTAVAPAAAFQCSHVASIVTDTPTYYNWIGAWFNVTSGTEGERFGFLLPYDEPNTPVVETQYYYDETSSSSASVLTVGPNNSGDLPEQILTLDTDRGPLAVYMPALSPDDCVRTRLYVAADGSTYHSRADHDYKYSPAKANTPGQCFDAQAVVGPDLTPAQAFVPEHLARAAPPHP